MKASFSNFNSYLSHRKQRVVVEGTKSEWLDVASGVPQGSVLGPLLFLIYINDLTEVVDSNIRLFADDTILYAFVDNPVVTADALNNDLNSMMIWANQWLVEFSPPKTVTLNVSRKKKKLPKPPLIMNNIFLKNVTSHKHLGVTLADDLGWATHIENIAIAANRSLDIFNALKYKLDRRSLEKLYFSYVRPKLEYACIVWDNCPIYLADLLDNVQIRAAKIISGAIARTSHALIYKELGWETLGERRKRQRLATMFRIINNQTPSYLRQPLPVNNNAYVLRNAINIPNLATQSATMQNSFYPKTINDWNNLDRSIRDSPSLETFKWKLKDTKHHPPDWFYSNDRFYSIIHARLRMKCSLLNDDLFSQIHVIESPQCPCGHQRETARHFLLECPLFSNERTIMLN